MNIIDRAAAQGGSVLVFRSAVYLYTIELKHLQPSPNSKERPPKPLRWSDELETTYYMIGLLSGGGITIAAVHGKDVHVLRLRHGGVNLISHWFCVASQPPTSVFLHRGHIICTYPKSGFECRDPINWNDKEMLPKLASGPAIQTYLAAMTVTIPGKLGLGGTTAGASVRTTYMVLCYDSYAIYMDDRKVLHGPPITWHYPAKEIYFQDNRAYIISSTHLEIRSLLGPSPHTGNQSQTQNEVQNRNETAVQLIEGKFRVLSGKSSTKIVILREDGYIYGFRPRQNLT
ncbi:hypothetical protein BDN72DRAFT_895726 [Pluteus cervinus]|uniref:Uncharacterized protein n=1 Tax=Pluteus cervinus TaxID=181527 RepID=A0ACD3AZE7_9AGAR|nr:hypothetical protein BDN72DRAFT_895726 [Pluteus cervinus]